MIAIIDFGLGNLGSMVNMLRKIGAQVTVSSDPSDIGTAGKLILPGVGSFDRGMINLKERGLTDILNKRVIEDKVPVLGVCLGMQLMTMKSEEGRQPGLGWVEGEAIRFNFRDDDSNLKIPHMGWNQASVSKPHPLLAGLEEENRFYFVHSYHVVCELPEYVLSTTSHGIDFTSAFVKDNIMGVQFHPEKSHKFGMRLLKNYAELL